MNSGIARDMVRNAMQQATDRGRGLASQRIVFAGSRAAQISIADTSKLPCALVPQELQNPLTGNFYFLLDYSQLDGPDELLP